MSEIKAWANTVGQQVENMSVDLVAQTAAGISEASGDVFFVGRPAQTGQDWVLKKITPTELEKMVYNYLTSNSIAPQLASVLGVGKFNKINPDNNFYYGDLNLIYETSVTQIGTSTTNKPSNVSYGSLLVVKTGNEYTIQLVVSSEDASTYVRHRYNATWTAWKVL